ncbi:MAG TPA: DNA polymerase ligase N-terminal domain-containing protein [Phycisphaerae bacterium]|nr:DNA polymerase ligase N-terminal domain-containing protein [Phycisphaerae bacterium]
MPTDPTTTEFVVLRHEDREGVHYDLMIDTGAALATWKCSGPPESAGESPIFCRQIGDHRRAYLDYEGPISGGRGEVRRHDRGHCEILNQSGDVWTVAFHGWKLNGLYELSRNEGDVWRLNPYAH